MFTRLIINLLRTGKLNVEGLITHRFPLERAVEAYELIDEGETGMIKVIFDLTLNAETVGERGACSQDFDRRATVR